MKNFFAIVLLFLMSLHLSAQSSNLRFENINKELKHSHILSIFQDSKGFLWFGTYAGVHKYDGYSFKVYDKVNGSEGLSNAVVYAITEDHEGNIWVGTEAGVNVISYKNDSIIRIVPKDDSLNQFKRLQIRAILQDKQGFFWMGTYGNGLYKYDPQTNTHEHFEHQTDNPKSLPSNRINTFLLDSKGNFWIGTEAGGLSLFDVNTKTCTNYLNNKNNPNSLGGVTVCRIFEDSRNTIWIGLWDGGLNRFDQNTNSFKRYTAEPNNKNWLPSNVIHDIAEDADGTLWIATFGSGLVNFDPIKEKFITYEKDKTNINSISNNKIWALLKDNYNNLWIGTFGTYIDHLDCNKQRFSLFETNNSSNSLLDNDVRSCAADNSGLVWIGTALGLNSYDVKTNTFKSYLTGNGQSSVIQTTFVDSKQRIWLGTADGLILFNKTTNKTSKYPTSSTDKSKLPEQLINAIEEDKEGNIWVAMHQNGVYMLKSEDIEQKKSEEASFINYRHNELLHNTISSDIVWTIHRSLDGDLYFGTAASLDRFDNQRNDFEHFRPQSVSFLYEEKPNQFWLSSFGQGLLKYNSVNDSIVKIGDALGFPSNVITAIIPDNFNNLWIYSVNGLLKLNTQTLQYQLFNQNEGLIFQTSNYNGHCKLKDGQILYGTQYGFNLIDPVKFQITKIAPKIILTDFLLFNQSITREKGSKTSSVLPNCLALTKEIELTHNQNVFTIEFAALDFSDPYSTKYSYKMEGFNTDWILTSSNRHSATYTNLDPGTYLFCVKAANSDGVWSEKPLTLSIKILPPWWKSVFAITSYFILGFLSILAILFLVFRRIDVKHKLDLKELEYQRQKEMEILKMQFFTNISHEFRTPLTLIITPIEDIVQSGKYNELSNKLSVIYQNAQRLLLLVNQLLDFRKLETGNMRLNLSNSDIIPFVKQIVNSFSELCYAKKINLSLNTNSEYYFLPFDADKIDKILYNLLSNSVKCTEENGRIEVKIETEVSFNGRNSICLKVIDNGIGIPEDEISAVFERFYQIQTGNMRKNQGSGIGLALTKELVELHGGTILAESIYGKGTTFTVYLPIIKHSEKKEMGEDLEIHTSDLIEPEEEMDDLENNNMLVETRKDIALIVEDNDDLRNFVAEQLSVDYEVHQAVDGMQGLKMAKQLSPNIIISDVMMPIMSGFELCKAIKNDEETSHIPVILLTARTSEESVIEGLEIGADDYITKPFSAKLLKIRIKNILDNRRELQKMFLAHIASPLGKDTVQEFNVNHVDKQFIKKLTDIVEENIANTNLDAEYLCDQLFLSRAVLYRKIKALTNLPVNEFIKILRLERATIFLKQGYKVKEVTFMVGFKTQPHFTRTFTQQFGITPTDYSNQIEKKDGA